MVVHLIYIAILLNKISQILCAVSQTKKIKGNLNSDLAELGATLTYKDITCDMMLSGYLTNIPYNRAISAIPLNYDGGYFITIGKRGDYALLILRNGSGDVTSGNNFGMRLWYIK